MTRNLLCLLSFCRSYAGSYLGNVQDIGKREYESNRCRYQMPKNFEVEKEKRERKGEPIGSKRFPPYALPSQPSVSIGVGALA